LKFFSDPAFEHASKVCPFFLIIKPLFGLDKMLVDHVLVVMRYSLFDHIDIAGVQLQMSVTTSFSRITHGSQLLHNIPVLCMHTLFL
jgi:hypothetical protein